MEHPFLMFLDHTQRRTTVGRTPLDEWSAHRRDLYLTTHDTHKRQISMPPVGFEPKISAGERSAAARQLRSWVRIPPGTWCRVLSARGLCDELITRPEESYRLWCVVVCDLETSRICAPYIYDISSLRVNPHRLDYNSRLSHTKRCTSYLLCCRIWAIVTAMDQKMKPQFCMYHPVMLYHLHCRS